MDWPMFTVWFAEVVIEVVFLTTVKHSVVAFVWVAGRYCEAASGTYSARKQCLPTTVGLNATEVAVPPFAEVLTVTPAAAPTWVPLPAGQPAPVISDGSQMKNLTLPEAAPSEPDSVAVSVTPASPKCHADTEASVARSGGTQVLRLPSAKSLSCAVVDCDERVSARKLEKHGGSSPKMRSRLTPPS